MIIYLRYIYIIRVFFEDVQLLLIIERIYFFLLFELSMLLCLALEIYSAKILVLSVLKSQEEK